MSRFPCNSAQDDLRTPIPRPRLRRGWALPAVLLAGLLAVGGCAIDPVRDAERTLASVPSAALAEAQALEAAGEHAEAAEAWLQLAEEAEAPARQQLELKAADAWLRAGDTRAASQVLTAIDQEALTRTQRELALLLDAEVALQRGRAGEAIAKLSRVNRSVLPADLKARYYGTLAAAQRLNKEPLAAAESLAALDRVLKEPAARLDNQVSLLFTLASLGRSGLDDAAAETGGRLRGWVELTRALSRHGAPSPEARRAYRQWRSGHRTHPARDGIFDAYYRTLAGGYAPDTDVLVLLPRGGRFGVAGDAVKDGIMAAYDADGGSRPALDFRASGGGRFDAGVDAGAELVIGPLQKSGVAALAGRASLPVPTLALNRAEGGATENLYQFSLAPEDEAINAANFAHASGLKRAAILRPRGPWGERMSRAFRGQWRALGGRIAGEEAYASGGFGSVVGKLMAADGAEDGPDLVFLVATAKTVEGLWSALQLGAAGVPVVATSHVYSGDFNPTRDAALAGLYFVDIPWLLDLERNDALSRAALRENLPNVSGPLARLYAMGIDAYRLAPRIADMGRNPGVFFPGETGGLNVDALGQLRRQLVLARFTGSGPEVQLRLEAASPPTDDGDDDAAADGDET